MDTLKVADIRRVLLQLGFEEIKKRDHVRFRLNTGGRDPVGTKYSHGEVDVWGGRINQMARQIHVSKQEFTDLVAGRLDRAWYHQHLMKLGLIPTGDA